jgi:hypothetical protein
VSCAQQRTRPHREQSVKPCARFVTAPSGTAGAVRGRQQNSCVTNPELVKALEIRMASDEAHVETYRCQPVSSAVQLVRVADCAGRRCGTASGLRASRGTQLCGGKDRRRPGNGKVAGATHVAAATDGIAYQIISPADVGTVFIKGMTHRICGQGCAAP